MDVTDNFYSAVLDASFELDLWGRLRRASEAARAVLLSTEYAAQVVRLSLVSQVAQSYFDLRNLDLKLDIARGTLASREEALRLVTKRFDERGQFGNNVRVHAEMARPGLLRCVKKKASANPKVPAVAVAGKVHAARACVWHNEHEAELGSGALRSGFDHECLFCAGKPGKVIEDWNSPVLRLRRNKDRKAHGACGDGRVVALKGDFAAETAVAV